MREVLRYQRLRFPTAVDLETRTETFSFTLAEYFERIQSSAPVALREAQQQVVFRARVFDGDRHEFARATILWGRKSGTIMNRAEWTAVPVQRRPQNVLQE